MLCMCFLLTQVDILKKINENKFLIFGDSVNENKEV